MVAVTALQGDRPESGDTESVNSKLAKFCRAQQINQNLTVNIPAWLGETLLKVQSLIIIHYSFR